MVLYARADGHSFTCEFADGSTLSAIEEVAVSRCCVTADAATGDLIPAEPQDKLAAAVENEMTFDIEHEKPGGIVLTYTDCVPTGGDETGIYWRCADVQST